MSVTFTKLFSSITASTIWCESSNVRIVWVTMLAMADRNGRVFASVPGLARLANVPTEECRVAVAKFLGPDPDSRTPDHEGRRIEPIDGGWRLLNHEKYRAIRDEEAIKKTKRDSINAKRAKDRAAAQTVDNVDTCRPLSNTVDRSRHNAEAEAEAYTEAEAEADSKATKKQTLPAPQSDATEKNVATWKAYKSAYLQRYCVEPVRNASVNSKIKQFVARLGDDAPHVAMHYVRSNASFYVRDKHGVGCMLKDAEGLRTEWATGRTVTHAEAQMADETAARGNVWSRVAEKLDAQERVIHEQVG